MTDAFDGRAAGKQVSRTKRVEQKRTTIPPGATRVWLMDVLDPVAAAWHRPRIEKRHQTGVQYLLQTRPAPIVGAAHQIGAQRIPLHITQDGQQMIIWFDRKGPEPALPDVPIGPMELMMAMNMAREQPLHSRTQVFVTGWPESQMKMIGHKTVANDPHRDMCASLAKQPNERIVGYFFGENTSPLVAAVENMVSVATHRSSPSPRQEQYDGCRQSGKQPIESKNSE
jgi:hypothetical protein